MKTTHNKKRNIGLVYELLLRSISSSLVEGNQDQANISLEIMKKRFAPETEIYSEFRIFDAIMNTSIKDTSVAAGILTEAKNAIKSIDYKKLYQEKSKLISEINKIIKDDSFYKRKIPNYREFATLGMVIEQSKQGNKSNLSQQVINEQRLIEFMLTEKSQHKNIEEMTDDKADNLVVKIMTDKINESYESLNFEQKNILGQYAIYASSNNEQDFYGFLQEVKKDSLGSLRRLQETTDNSILLSKVEDVISKVQSLPEKNVSDTDLARYLKISELKEKIGALR
jgi:Lhr-like helicase